MEMSEIGEFHDKYVSKTDLSLKDISLFHVKLLTKYHVPNSTIQRITDEISKIVENVNEMKQPATFGKIV